MTKNLTAKRVWDRWPQLLAFALVFQIAEGLCFAPLLGLAGHALLGRPVVDSTALVSFILSPRGFSVLFLAAATLLIIRLFEHAGLSAIVLGALEDKGVHPEAAFLLILQNLPRLASIGARVIGCGLVVALPFFAMAGFFAARLSQNHDINFYLATRPPEFVIAVVILGIMAAATLACAAWLFVRWRLVVQTCVFEGRNGWAAFRDAAILSRGVRWSLAGKCAAVALFELALASAAAGLGQLAVKFVLDRGEARTASLVIFVVSLVLLRTVISAVITSIGEGVGAAVFTIFYWKRKRALGHEPVFSSFERMAESSTPARRLALGWMSAVVVGLCAAEMFGVLVMLNALRQERPVTVTAHRGGHLKAPENTVAAIREAIAVGAQYAEIDVQLSRDGVLVVTHDSDFSRMGGVARKVWDLTYEEIRAIPLGRGSDPEFRDERAPTFDEVLAVARDQIKLNVELKYYGDHQPRLAERVVEEVRARDMTRQVIIQCLEYRPLQDVRRIAPEIPVGYLLSVNARQPSRLNVDFLGAALSRANGGFVRAAHRRGQEVHVWTVNTPEAMERMIDLGVDSLITDKPAEALQFVRHYRNLSPSERTLREARAWLAN